MRALCTHRLSELCSSLTRQRTEGSGSYSKGRYPHIIIAGKIESAMTFTDILQVFYNNVRSCLRPLVV